MNSAITATSTNGAAQFSNRRSVSMPRTMMAISSTQKSANDSHCVHGVPADDRRRVRPAVPGDRAEQDVEGLAADPGLDAEPAAGDQRPQDGRQVGPAQAERGAGEDRVRDAVLGAGVAVQQHRHQHDHVGERDRDERLHPVHPERDQAGGQHVGRDAVGHPDPQRRVVVGGPGAPLDRHGREVAVGVPAVAYLVGAGQADPAVGIVDFFRNRSHHAKTSLRGHADSG